MNNKKKAILAVVLTATIWPLLFYVLTRETEEHRITRHGLDAEATIVRMVDQHETRHDHRPLMRITVEGEWGGASQRAEVDRRIDDEELDTMLLGNHVAIRYDREHPDLIVVLRVVPTVPTGPPPS